jgi:hypothetical protein
VVDFCWNSGFGDLEPPVAKVPGNGPDDNIVILKGLCSPVKPGIGHLFASMPPVQFERSAQGAGCVNRTDGRFRRPIFSAAFARS